MDIVREVKRLNRSEMILIPKMLSRQYRIQPGTKVVFHTNTGLEIRLIIEDDTRHEKL